MQMYNKLWADHRDAGAPRPSANVDVARGFASLPAPAALSDVYAAVSAEFGGAAFCKNNFADEDASESSHYRAVYAIVKFLPTEPLTFTELAAANADEWEEYARCEWLASLLACLLFGACLGVA
jgi:hypothetical protein